MTAAGWHPDPRGRHEHRYWDGFQWTDHVADGGAVSIDPVADDTPPRAAGVPVAAPAAPEAGPEPEPARVAAPPRPSPWGFEEEDDERPATLWARLPATPREADARREEEPAEPAAEPAEDSRRAVAALLSVVAPGTGHLVLGIRGPRRTVAAGMFAATVFAVALAYLSFGLFLIGLGIWATAAAYALTDLRLGPSELRRARLTVSEGGWVLLAGGVALVVSLLLPWYRLSGRIGVVAELSSSFSGFASLRLADVLLFTAGACSVLTGVAALSRAATTREELPPLLAPLVTVAGAIALVLTAFRLLVDPVAGPGTGGLTIGRGPGILLAAAASLVILAAGRGLQGRPRREAATPEG